MNIRALNLFVKLVLEKGEKAYFSKKYQSFTNLENDYVVINPMSAPNTDDSFIQHIKNSHGYNKVVNYPCAMWTALHEIGHLRTDDESETDLKTRGFCQFAYENNLMTYDQINSIYYDMPDEWAATEWAIDFVESHKTFCKIFARLI